MGRVVRCCLREQWDVKVGGTVRSGKDASLMAGGWKGRNWKEPVQTVKKRRKWKPRNGAVTAGKNGIIFKMEIRACLYADGEGLVKKGKMLMAERGEFLKPRTRATGI